MVIELLTIKGFGKLSGLDVKLEKGLNLLYGANESGKTTLQWFIRGMLFGLKGGRTSRDGLQAPLKRFRPWSGSDYGGSMRYMLDDGSSYRVDRDFERNTAAVYDAAFKNVSGGFDSGRDRGLMLAERLLGLNEACFDRTVLIRQMETRPGDDGSGELISRLMNLNRTGQEELSFKKASEALKEALKMHVGTERTTTQPADRIAARLAELTDARRKLAEKRSSRISTANELQEAMASEIKRKKSKAYLDSIKGLIDGRKQLEEENAGCSRLSDIAGKLEKTEKELFAAKEELKKLQAARASANSGGTPGAYRSRGTGTKIRPVILLLCAAAGAAAATGIFYHPIGYAASALFIAASIATALLAKQKQNRGREPLPQQKDADSHLQQYEQIMHRVMALNGKFKDICSEASMAAGKNIEGTESLKAAMGEKSEALDILELKLREKTDAALANGADYEAGFFAPSTLKDILSQSNPNWLQDSWEYEMEQAGGELVEAALKIKELETLLKGDREDGEELQSIDEEIAGLTQRKTELDKTGASLRLALEVLTEASQEIQVSFAPLLNSGMSRIIAEITGGRYQDLRADDALSLNAVSPEASQVRGVMALSGGTADQMYLALRLALSDLLSKGKESPPLLLDEVFSQYDDQRTAKTLEYLFKEYSDRQVILFTCKEREVETAVNITGGRLNVVRL